MIGGTPRTTQSRLFYKFNNILSFYVIAVTGAVLTVAHPLKPTELSLDRPGSLNISSLAIVQPYCTGAQTWGNPRYNPNQCRASLSELYLQTVHHFGTTDFEFVAPGAHPTHEPLTRQPTPQKWNLGEVTNLRTKLSC